MPASAGSTHYWRAALTGTTTLCDAHPLALRHCPALQGHTDWHKYVHFNSEHYVRNLVASGEDAELLVGGGWGQASVNIAGGARCFSAHIPPLLGHAAFDITVR